MSYAKLSNILSFVEAIVLAYSSVNRVDFWDFGKLCSNMLIVDVSWRYTGYFAKRIKLKSKVVIKQLIYELLLMLLINNFRNILTSR